MDYEYYEPSEDSEKLITHAHIGFHMESEDLPKGDTKFTYSIPQKDVITILCKIGEIRDR